jgi:hypothetical protein
LSLPFVFAFWLYLFPSSILTHTLRLDLDLPLV